MSRAPLSKLQAYKQRMGWSFPWASSFESKDGVVFHTYSAYARGLDGIWGMYAWLDRAPLGRNERDMWWRRHDEYAAGRP